MDAEENSEKIFRNSSFLLGYLGVVFFCVVAIPSWMYLHFWSLAIFAVLIINLLILIAHYKNVSIPVLSSLVAWEYKRIKNKTHTAKEAHKIKFDLEINFFKFLYYFALRVVYGFQKKYLNFLHHAALLFCSLEDNHELLIDWNRPLENEKGTEALYNILGVDYQAREDYVRKHTILFKEQKQRALHFSTAVSVALTAIIVFFSVFWGTLTSASTYGWIQSGWGGGTSAVTAVHPGDRTGWNKYSSSEPGLNVSSALTLKSTTTSFLYTSYSDFSTNVSSNAYVTSTGAIIMLKPFGAICSSSVECALSRCVSNTCHGEARTWNPVGASTDMNDSANYSGSGPLLATDDLIFDSGATSSIATANLNIGSITTTAGYTGAWSVSGRTITSSGNLTFDGTGNLNLGNGITMNGASGVLHVAGGVVVNTSCAVTMNTATAGVIDFDNFNGDVYTFKSLTLGDNAKVSISGSGAYAVRFKGPATVLTIGSNAILTINQPSHFIGTADQSLFSLAGAYTINGSSNLYISASPGATLTVSDFVFSGTGGVWLYEAGNVKFEVNDISLPSTTRGIVFFAQSLASTTVNFHGNIICPDRFTLGNYNSATAPVYNLGGGTFTIGSYKANEHISGYEDSGDHISNINLQTSQWSVSGDWAFGSTHTIDPGTSKVTFTNTATITSNGKSFYEVEINAPGKTITLADDLSTACGHYNVIAGSVNLNGHSVTCY